MGLILLASTFAVAQTPVTTASPVPAVKPTLKVLGFLGKGIAVSPSDPMDFEIVKAGLGVFVVPTHSNSTEYKVGVLFLDDVKYKLRGVTVEDGAASGKVLDTNNTEVGSFNVSSVDKGSVEVWAGALIINGKTQYLYLVGLPRPIKPLELKNKIVNYCKIHTNDTRCANKTADFCQKNPDNKKCKEIFKDYCSTHMVDARCRNFISSYCKEHPEIDNCRLYSLSRAKKFCAEHPESLICARLKQDLIKFCMKNPNHKRCREYCADNPEKCQRVIKSIADFCVDHPKQAQCLSYCKEHPKACGNLTKDLADFCVKSPSDPKCKEYCINHPVACKVVSRELADFCIGNSDNPRCVNYCKEHPFACRKVVTDMGSYCAKHKDVVTCQVFCKKFPRKCEASEPQVVEIEPESPTTIVSGVVSNISNGTVTSQIPNMNNTSTGLHGWH